MTKNVDRRKFLLSTGTIATAGMASRALLANEEKTLILGISCSPRKGKTTATSVQIALEAAREVNTNISVEFIDLGGKNISAWMPPDQDGNSTDDFDTFLPLLKSANLGGIIIGTPVFFRNMSSICAAFLERLGVLRKPELLLADKAVGALSVGAYRNGGQELAIQQIQTAMLCHECMIVGGKPGAHQGATLWNAYQDDITKDEFGVKSAKNLGIRVAEAALKI